MAGMKGHKNHRTGLYPKEGRLLKRILQGNKPAVAYAQAYKTDLIEAGKNVGTVLARDRFRKALDKAGMTDARLAMGLVEGLGAMKQIVVDKQVQEYPDHQTRHQFIKTGLIVKGIYTKDQAQAEEGEPLVIKAIQFVGNNTIEVSKKPKEEDIIEAEQG